MSAACIIVLLLFTRVCRVVHAVSALERAAALLWVHRLRVDHRGARSRRRRLVTTTSLQTNYIMGIEDGKEYQFSTIWLSLAPSHHWHRLLLPITHNLANNHTGSDSASGCSQTKRVPKNPESRSSIPHKVTVRSFRKSSLTMQD